MGLKVFENRPLSEIKNSVAVVSGKGGVGKSTVTVALACMLARRGLSVGILDADLYGPSIATMLQVKKAPMQVEGIILPAEVGAIKVISMAYFLPKEGAAILRAPQANKVILQFIEKIKWGKLDWLLIDLPPGTSDIHLTVASRVERLSALLVTTPQQVALEDVRKSQVMCKRLHIPLLGIVENMSYLMDRKSKQVLRPFGQGGAERLSKEFSLPVLAQLGLDPLMGRSADRGELADFAFDDSFSELALRVIAGVKKEKGREWQMALSKNRDSLSLQVESEERRKIEVATLQESCPCASCKGRGISAADVKVMHIEKVGRIGFRFTFSSGCSYGIYEHKLLQEISV